MELFNIICGVCSILGLVFSIISIFMVTAMKINIKNSNSNNLQGQIGSVNTDDFTQIFCNIADPKMFYENIKTANEIQKGFSDNDDDQDQSMTFVVENDKGESVKCEVLFTFENEETKKNYIVYTDNTEDKDGNTKVYASIYNPDVDETKLLPIESEKEWKTIETILETLQESDA